MQGYRCACMSVKVDGIEEVTKYFNSKLSPENTRKALLKAGALVERSAKQKAPKDNGQLAQSIQYDVEATSATCIVFTPLEYAPYVEYGTGLYAEENGRKDVPWHYQDERGEWHTTSGQKPQPFLRPALTENENKIAELLQGALLHD